MYIPVPFSAEESSATLLGGQDVPNRPPDAVELGSSDPAGPDARPGGDGERGTERSSAGTQFISPLRILGP